MLIKAYGQFWNPDVVDWGSVGSGHQGKLEGRTKIRGTYFTIDFWKAVGLYVLIDEFRPVYVGKVGGP